MTAPSENARLVEIAGNPAPPGAAVGMIVGRGRVPLRTAWWPATTATPKGTVFLIHGRAEFIEKYFEVIGELLARGFAVLTCDLRGQGGSGRLLPNPEAGHVASFHDYIADLDTVLAAARPHLPEPFYGLAHSTGGAALLLGVRKLHPRLARIVVSAPLLGLLPGRLPDSITGFVLDVACLIGLRRKQVNRRMPGASVTDPFVGNPLTSDRARYDRNRAILEAAPDLQVGPPTLGWVKAARDTMVTLRKPDLIARITIPTLLIACGGDRVVSVPPIERLGRALVNGGTILIPGSRHELMMEADRFREQFWAAFDAFVPGEA